MDLGLVKRQGHLALIAMAIFCTIGLFQNCSEGFQYGYAVDGSSNSRSPNPNPLPLPTPGPGVIPDPGTSMINFKTCYATSAVPTTLAACLNTQPDRNGALYSAAQITTCQTAGATSDILLATCMSKTSEVIQNHRDAKQFDYNSCASINGPAAVANCFGKRGIKNSLTQVQIDQCVTSDGAIGVEKCLRRNGYLYKRPTVMQSDAALCNAVEGSATNLALCLHDSNLIPLTVTQANIDTCINNPTVTFTRVVRCLRVNNLLNKALMQVHINECNAAAGQVNIATCIDNNGLLPVDPATQLAAFQTSINNCVTAVTLASVARCLRTNNLISPVIMQPHIGACFDAAGVNAFNCITANFTTVPAGFNDAELKACFAANLNTAANAARCMAGKRFLSSVPVQAHINACNRFANGQAGIAACLDASGAKPAALVQANIDTCVTAAGLAGVATCLHTNNIVPAYNRMLLAGGGLNACVGCHSAINMAGGMTISLHASVLMRVVPGNAAGSVLNNRVNNAANPMPPSGLQAQALRDQIGLWINQGANNN